MKQLPTFLALTAVLCLSIPATGFSRDRDRHHHHKHHSHSSHRHYRSHSYHHHSPSIYFRSYRPYSYYGYSPYFSYPYGYPYYARPSLGLSFSTGPSYATYSRTVRTGGYDDELAEDVQRALARRGYYRGEIDGQVGPGTRSAIRRYQYRNRLEVTGRIDRSLLRSLGLS